jgi:selenide,water dikinase
MTPVQLERRRRVMRRSMALHHCICDPHQPCPCDAFKDEGRCHCAGEGPAAEGGPVRLTEHVRNAGCASKISKDVLHRALADLPGIDDARVLVGASAGDDAGVIMLGKDSATILTVDVFSACVDDPYTFGQIAAANSLSDIYAMGGKPQVALSVIGFPVDKLPAEAMRQILLGGVEKMQEAGICVIGGHSINDADVKCGFAVVGTCPPDSWVRNSGAKVNDAIVLTKPLGTGIVCFAQQVGLASEAALREAASSMAALNQTAGRLMTLHGVHAATDVTGFGLLGHMIEIARNSNVEIALDFDRIPLLEGAADLARQDVLPGAVERNRQFLDGAIFDLSGLVDAQQAILLGPETSGGLLVFLPPDRAQKYLSELHAGGVASATIIGQVKSICSGGRITAHSSRKSEFSTLALPAEAAPPTVEVAECCAHAPPEPPVQIQSQKETARQVADALPPPAAAEAFKSYLSAVNAPGALGTKQKKLIALALSVMSKCTPCVKINSKAARDAGASEEEIAEAAALGIAFGGAPVAMFYNAARNE